MSMSNSSKDTWEPIGTVLIRVFEKMAAEIDKQDFENLRRNEERSRKPQERANPSSGISEFKS